MKEENTAISLQLPKAMLENLKALAKENSISTTAYIRLKLTEILKKEKVDQE